MTRFHSCSLLVATFILGFAQCVQAQNLPVSIVNCKDGLMLEVESHDLNKDGGRIMLHAANTGRQQLWAVEPAKDGYVYIISRPSGKVLDAHSADATKSGCKVQLFGKNGGEHQQWLIRWSGKGVGVTLINRATGRLVLDAHAPDAATNGCKLQLWEPNGGDHQKFVVATGHHHKFSLASPAMRPVLSSEINDQKLPGFKAALAQADPDLYRPDQTTGGQIGFAAGLAVGTYYGGPQGAAAGAVAGCLLGHGTDRVITRISNDITGPAWKDLEQSPATQKLDEFVSGTRNSAAQVQNSIREGIQHAGEVIQNLIPRPKW